MYNSSNSGGKFVIINNSFWRNELKITENEHWVTGKREREKVDKESSQRISTREQITITVILIELSNWINYRRKFVVLWGSKVAKRKKHFAVKQTISSVNLSSNVNILFAFLRDDCCLSILRLQRHTQRKRTFVWSIATILFFTLLQYKSYGKKKNTHTHTHTE